MKSHVIKLVWMVVAYTAVYIILAQTVLQFPGIFALAIVGHGLVAYMVYAILTDKYSTKKKFRHWYGDNPRIG